METGVKNECLVEKNQPPLFSRLPRLPPACCKTGIDIPSAEKTVVDVDTWVDLWADVLTAVLDAVPKAR